MKSLKIMTIVGILATIVTFTGTTAKAAIIHDDNRCGDRKDMWVQVDYQSFGSRFDPHWKIINLQVNYRGDPNATIRVSHWFNGRLQNRNSFLFTNNNWLNVTGSYSNKKLSGFGRLSEIWLVGPTGAVCAMSTLL